MPAFANPEDYKYLRELLQKIGYADSGILEVLGIKDIPSISGTDLPVLMRRTKGGTPLETLVRLFLIGVPVDGETLKKAIMPLSLESLAEGGLIRRNGGEISASVKLLPFMDHFIAFDLPERLYSPNRQDYVMGIGRSTITLANSTIRKPVHYALDLGTGCGTQAFLAAGHCENIVATDKHPRAVGFAEFNARLNGLTNVECVEGNLFEPVMGKSFDLVISNPPFVISPESTYIYRDGGMGADRICREIIGKVPQFLNQGGYCQMLCNWVEKASEDWRERLQTWFEGTGCDAWVMRSETGDAETYASTWIKHTEKYEPEDFEKRLDKWLEYYDKEGISSVGAGLITMRKTGGRTNWYRADEAPEKILGPCGEHISAGFEAKDFLEMTKGDEALLNARFQVSPNVRLERASVPSPEGWIDTVYRIQIDKGLAYSGNIDPYVANLLVGCNGRITLRELLSDMARALKVDSEQISQKLCALARSLIERGFLLPPV